MTPENIVADARRAGMLLAEVRELAERYGVRAEIELSPENFYEKGMELIGPVDMTAVRALPAALHSAGIDYLLYTQEGSPEDENGYCADWHAQLGRKHLAEIISDTSVRTARDLVSWLDRKDRATRMHAV